MIKRKGLKILEVFINRLKVLLRLRNQTFRDFEINQSSTNDSQHGLFRTAATLT